MSTERGEELKTRAYFVDEAGDGSLFDSRGKVIIGREGCSRYFMLGLLDVPDPIALSRDLADLRARLLADPYFNKVPSMRPESRKTAVAFHAKDELPEVRREVFALLLRHKLHFYATVKTKLAVLSYVRYQNEKDPTYRYHPNDLYDLLARRLFKDRLHQSEAYEITFAKRGKADRTDALKSALETARARFSEQWGLKTASTITIAVTTPHHAPGLQAADYFLWTLQRCYERREDRFIELLWPQFSLIQDIDDTREAAYGAYYSRRKPLTAAALGNLPGV